MLLLLLMYSDQLDAVVDFGGVIKWDCTTWALLSFEEFFGSHPQALAQCEHTLTRLRVAKKVVDDTAGAAQIHVSKDYFVVVKQPIYAYKYSLSNQSIHKRGESNKKEG
ncbi:arogenate dehydratase/prephenate dehydratase 2, chloroplastic-like protein [Tanacetum coccineum]